MGRYTGKPASLIRILYDDSVLYADEDKSTGSPRINVRYYGKSGRLTGLDFLVSNPARAPTKEKLLPHINIFSKADGTPEFGRIDYSGSILASKIEITHHYFDRGVRDIEAVDTFTNFSSGSDTTDNTTINLVTNAGGNGKIGDREVFKVGSTVYELVEARSIQLETVLAPEALPYKQNHVGSSTAASWLDSGGALSIGNPTATFVTLRLPDGIVDALVFTCYVFSESNYITPPGEHMFVYALQ